MDGIALQAARGFRLCAPGDPYGVSCGDGGPFLGPIRLLDYEAGQFAPRPAEILSTIFGQTFRQTLDCRRLWHGLVGVAKALNEGNRPLAMVATQFLHLPILSSEESDRAAQAERLQKASPDDPKHPGWPAGSPDSEGGEFEPKPDSAKQKIKDRAKRLAIRRLIRKGLVRLFSAKRLARLGIEVVADAVPGADIAGAAATVEDMAEMASEYASLKHELDVATKFIEDGPYSLEQLQASPENEAFSSFDAFKKEDLIKRFGPAGDGMEYHHIIEQNAEGTIPNSIINSTRNIVKIPRLLHEEISAEFSKIAENSQSTLRAGLRGKPLEEAENSGLEVMRKIGILK